MLRAHNEQGRQALHEVADQASAAAGAGTAAAPRAQDAQQPAAALQQQARGPGWGGSHFDSKTDKGSADLYFHYYGCLQHQQNMLQDYIRTGEEGGGGLGLGVRVGVWGYGGGWGEELVRLSAAAAGVAGVKGAGTPRSHTRHRAPAARACKAAVLAWQPAPAGVSSAGPTLPARGCRALGGAAHWRWHGIAAALACWQPANRGCPLARQVARGAARVTPRCLPAPAPRRYVLCRHHREPAGL